MREQLIQYVNLLFAGAQGCEDIKQEILQNTLDRYDDLIAEGKVPEAAYRLAISGIGDISEILGTQRISHSVNAHIQEPETKEEQQKQKKLRATAIALYILCPIPLFLLSELGAATIGLCGLLLMVAIATALIIMSSKKENEEEKQEPSPMTPQQSLRKTIKNTINVAGLVIYLLLSFTTHAWYITWLVFPIEAAIWELTKAILDLKEATKHEN
ncbi:MAG: hypothetical protein IJN20_03300 [Oscillospiraceae bacterium]|nr:hypothetical protein [Oscillospiraceae bacterium]